MTTESITNATHENCFGDCCPDCGCSIFFTDFNRGEKVCKQCGLVVDESITDGRAEPDYGDERSKERMHYGMPVNRHFPVISLSTEISGSNRDGNGNRLPAANRIKYRRLRALQQRARIQNGIERNLHSAMGAANLTLRPLVRRRNHYLQGLSPFLLQGLSPSFWGLSPSLI